MNCLHQTTRLVSTVAVAACMLPLVSAADPPAVEPIADIEGHPWLEIKCQVQARSESGPLRYALAKVRRERQAVAAPSGMAVHPKTGLFTWRPTPSQAGSYEVTLAVKDAEGQGTSTTFRITVPERDINSAPGEVGDLLRQWYAEGSAAGNTGDFYDNRDGDRSTLNFDWFGQLDKVPYTAAQRKKHADQGAQDAILKHVTIGNSSTFAAPPEGSSNVRFYYAQPSGMQFLYDQYRNNNLYVYPAHRDYLAGHNRNPGWGDIYPANSACVLASQGSAGSERPFLDAIAYTLAAFRPEVKKKLIESGLLMPTVQMLLRSTNRHLDGAGDYLTGKAHPAVFDRAWVNALKMVTLAHEIRLETIPPLVQIKVVEEDTTLPGKDFFEGFDTPKLPTHLVAAWKTEKLHDTPAAVCRVFRGPEQVRRLVVSAEDSFDINKRPLTYQWRVLRGDARRIQIKPLNAAGSVVEVRVPYHERYTGDAASALQTNRVDIAVFAHNGVSYSAPSFVTFYSLDNEARTYDADGRIVEIGYIQGDLDCSVTSWKGLFALLEEEPADFAGKLLRQQFKEEERAALVKVGAEYKTAFEKLTAAEKRVLRTGGEYLEIIAAEKKAEEKVTAAQKEFDAAATRKNQLALADARTDLDALKALRPISEDRFKKAQKQHDVLGKAVIDLLASQPPGLDQPVRALVEGRFRRLIDDVDFYIRHQAVLAPLIPSGDEARTARLRVMRQLLVELGIVKMQGESSVLSSIRTGTAPAAERLTRYERHLVQCFNAELLSNVLYPKVLHASFTINFVDQRLTTPKGWRDVYRHDDKGRRIGWIRQDGTNEYEFNVDGHIILEKDERGRALKARTVRYELDPEALQAGVRLVTQAWGDKVVFYEYDGDDDTTGRIKRQETVDTD
jgi:hypothetical protein